MDTNKNKDRDHRLRALGSSIAVVAVLAAFICVFFWGASPATRAFFANWFSLSTDLNRCEESFAYLLMVATTLSVSLGIIPFGLILSNALDVYSYKRSFQLYRKQLLVGTCLSLLLLLPLMFGHGAWYDGGRRGVARVDLATACAASFHTTFYRLHGHLLIVMLLGWVNILVMLNLRWMIAEGRDPNQLSDDPRVRAIQLAAMERTKWSLASGRFVAKVVLTGLAAALFYLGASSMKPATARFIHTFTWERQKAKVVETGMQCVLEVKVRRGWSERSRADCSSDAATVPSTPALGAGAWRITKIPTAKLTYRTPEGEYSFGVFGDFFMKMPTSIGTEVEVLRNPASPEAIDKIFDGGDVKRMFYRLLMIVAGAVAVYYLWIRGRQKPIPV
ncbi:hypothetical protein OHD62_18200 [Mesorhizobium sp. YC-39]|uniref:hypothetical protein n=1 Tax=unclassified Mesorhizobium TaxID=325217 RepID=UPI0021E7B050|nr:MULTISPECIES: hypothetical protein [unclassified Mesorhizobium]MCV3209776.1 hypothetical protein [Mesorhizobium sp. YC-2]MCV3230306.1 hypothetical protein [Mesorhizobium sp. YC-39]